MVVSGARIQDNVEFSLFFFFILKCIRVLQGEPQGSLCTGNPQSRNPHCPTVSRMQSNLKVQNIYFTDCQEDHFNQL